MAGRSRGLSAIVVACLLAAGGPVALAQVQEAPPAPRFAIKSFAVEGNTILPQAEVDALVAPYVGPDRDFGSVQQALEALQDAYTKRGFTAVRVLVPEQDLVSGRVRLQVIEARLRKITVQGNQFFTEPNVVATIPSLQAGEPPNTTKISQSVQLANENPAKQVTVVLEGTDEPGKTDAIVRVTDENPKRVTLSVDNTGTPGTGSLRVGAGYQDANLTGRDDVLTAQYVTAPTKLNDVKIFGVGYRLPMYQWGGAFDFVAGYSDVNSGTVAGLFTVSGSGTILGARYTQTLPNIDAYQQKLSLGLDYKAFTQNVGLLGVPGSLVPDITVHPLSVVYTGRLSRAGDDISFSAGVSQNFGWGNDGRQADFTAQRPGARADYRIYRIAAAWSKLLPNDLIARLVGNAQVASGPLVPGEQFGLGGQDSVRGFYEREAANDSGERLSAELYGPDLGARLGDGWRARALGFYDMANGRDKDPERAGHNGLSSVGVGLRASYGRSLSMRVDAASVLNQSLSRPGNRGRIHFSVVYSF
ncbi:MAG: ShlB/FhaC/HecB family hemolysin secretion/activation protein [Clostridia bacterium]